MRSWLFEAPTPLAPADHEWIVHELEHRVERLRPTGLLGDDLAAAWDRLLDESDPAWLGHREDLQRLTARSVHIGHSRPPDIRAILSSARSARALMRAVRVPHVSRG